MITCDNTYTILAFINSVIYLETLAFNGDDVINVSYAIHSGRVFPMYAMVVYKTDISR